MLKNLLISLVSLTLSLLVADWVLGRLALGPVFAKAKEQGVAYDTRDRLQVVFDYRRKDPDWFTQVPARTFIKHPLLIEGKRVQPLGGVAAAHIVGCNEGGFHSTFRNDEAGFPNPPGTWPLQARRYIFLVGDSFTEGACVNEGDSIADNLRKRYLDVVNLGMRGNGPLLELATIREYVPRGRVAYVFWLYSEENDLRDLRAREEKDPLLVRYLEDGFTQNLWQRQGEVNAAVRAFAEHEIQAAENSRAIIFPHLRDSLKQLWYRRYNRGTDESDVIGGEGQLDLLLQIVRVAKHEVESKGGHFVFVYVPGKDRLGGGTMSPEAQLRDKVLDGVAALRVPIVDLVPPLSRHPDPLSLFPLRMTGHYTPDGYRMIAATLSDFLRTGDADSLRTIRVMAGVPANR